MGTQYPKERKDAIIIKMLPPQNISVPELVKQENIPYGTLYTWKQQYLRKHSKDIPSMTSSNAKWTANQKFAVIIETSTLNEQELNEYCRKKGLYVADIATWKTAFIKGSQYQSTANKEDKNKLKELRTENKSLKKDLRRKEKALAETAALLVLRKKLDALWEESGDE